MLDQSLLTRFLEEKFERLTTAAGNVNAKFTTSDSLAPMIKFERLPPLSVYIHIPWCLKKCPYCDFNSHKLNTELPEKHYVAALIADLEQALPLIWGRSVQSVFIGGGTPSLFSGDGIDQILMAVRRLTRLVPSAEITIEANPGTVDNSHIVDYAKAGVNRISFGVQSFNDRHLQALGRIHDSEQATKAINLAKQYFTRINLDLIYALPNQTMTELADDLEQALNFNVSHLSCYNLTIEPNTAFARQIPANLPDNDLCYMMQDEIGQRLQQHSYKRYEISAYTKGGSYCQHNLNYWQFGDYLGIGAGAHTKLSFHDKIIRQIRQKHPQAYMDTVVKNKHIIENKLVAPANLPFEFALNSLRLIEGVPLTLFVKRSGLPLSCILSKLNLAQERGFIALHSGNIVPTKLGQDFLNDLLMLFLDDIY